MSRIALTQCWIGAATALFVLAGNTHSALAQIPASWNAFSVDLSFRRYEVTSDGTPTDRKPMVTRYRLERISAPGTWRTITTLLDGDSQAIKTRLGTKTVDPFFIRRVEDDGDGSALRLYDRDGKQVRLPRLPTQLVSGSTEAFRKANPTLPADLLAKESPTPRRLGSGREWVNALIALPENKNERQNALFAQYGGRVGSSQGLDRYAATYGGERIDVSVDPNTAVIVAIDRSRDGALIAHTTISYRLGSQGELIRSGVRAEQLSRGNKRAVTEIEFARVTFDKVEIR